MLARSARSLPDAGNARRIRPVPGVATFVTARANRLARQRCLLPGGKFAPGRLHWSVRTRSALPGSWRKDRIYAAAGASGLPRPHDPSISDISPLDLVNADLRHPSVRRHGSFVRASSMLAQPRARPTRLSSANSAQTMPDPLRTPDQRLYKRSVLYCQLSSWACHAI